MLVCWHGCVGPVDAERCLTCQLSQDLAGTNHPHLHRMAPAIRRRDGKVDHEIARPAWIESVTDRCRFGSTFAHHLKLIESKLDVMIAIAHRIGVTGSKRLQHAGNRSFFHPEHRHKTIQVLPGIAQSMKRQLPDEHWDRSLLICRQLQQPIP